MRKKSLFLISIFILIIMSLTGISHASDNDYEDIDDYSTVNTRENIRDYDIEIYLNEDATLDVTEKITVYAAGDEIVHGIYRDFPTQYKNKRIGFDVKQVLLDGEGVVYSLESLYRGARIKIGDEDKKVPEGLHTYTISYSAEREIAFEDDYDELYWNVIGTGWNFSIEHCHARVYLPKGAKVIEDKLKTYTGLYGNEGKTKDVYMYTSGNYIDYEINEKLSKNEAFTISVCLEKGTLIEPSMLKKIAWTLEDNVISITLLVLLIFLIIWQFKVWKKEGKDPRPNVIIPKYFPPEGMAPADVKYISSMGNMNKILEATIINLAVKGYFKFEKGESKKTIKIVKNKEKTGLSDLKGYEAKIYKEFNEEEELKYSESFQKKIQNILDDIEDDQKEKYNDKLFFKNTKLIMISIIASIICVTFSVIAGIIVNQFAALEYLSQLMLIIPIAFFIAFITSIIGSLKRNKSIVLIIILVIFLIVPFIMVAFAAMVSILNFIMEFSLNVWSFCAVLVDNIVFYKLIRRYSEEGLRIKEDIEGFKMFIKTAKDDDFKEKTPEMFDKYFPYAYVLGLENKWASKFEDVLKESNYSPDWCTYAMFNSGTFNVTAFTNSFSSSFSSGMSSASTVPSSSGGSGGGGFSGGGGGGRRPEEAGNRAI